MRSREPCGLLAAIYPEDHPYRFPLSGTEAGVGRLDRSALVDFHSRSWLAVRPTIIVAGDVDPDELARELEIRLTPWAGTLARASDPPEVERSDAARLLLVDRPGAAQAVVRGIHRAAAFEPGL